MVESTLEYPDMRTSLHQFVEIIEGAVRSEWNIAVLAHHNLDLHTALYGSVKGFLYAVGEGEIRVENLDAILCRVDGTTIEMSHHLISLMRLTVCYSHHFMICRKTPLNAARMHFNFGCMFSWLKDKNAIQGNLDRNNGI